MNNNKKDFFPRYAPLEGKLVRRAPFLSGDARCYYGPGQPPVMEELGYNGPVFSTPDLVMLDYVPPDDWPSVGSLLRVPQMVHFSSTGDLGPVDEYHRLITVFNDMVTTLRTLRPTATFGYLVDWFDNAGLFGAPDDNDLFFSENKYLHMISPPVGVASFFSTDYLHVFAGNAIYDYFQFDNHGLPARNSSIIENFSDVGSPIYIPSRARVTENYDSFARYSVKVFGNSEYPVNDEFIQASCVDMADFGFSYEGGTTSLDATSLLTLIASHFGFDSETGRDL